MAESQKRVILAVSNDLTGDSRVHKMAMTLFENGFYVRVIGRKLPASIPLPEVPYETKRMRFFFNKGPLFYAEMNLRYFLYFLLHSYDFATANDLDTLLGLYKATKIRHKKLIYDSHEYFTEVPELVRRPKTQKKWRNIEQHIFPKLKRCITVCDSIAEIYHKTYGVRVSVIRNLPYRLEVVPPKAQLQLPSSNVILYQGALNMGRGLETMIQAMQYIDNACLLIIGDGDIRAELQKISNESGLSRRIIFTGKIPFHELPAYTQLATIGISLEEDLGGNYHYALPNKLFDYIQAGKPVLVSNLPEMAQIVSTYQCGEIVKDREPHNLAKQISNLLADNDRLNNFHTQCINAAQELCWEQQEQKILELYR